MPYGDFVCTSANDGTHLFRPITARAQTLWQEKGFNNFNSIVCASCITNTITINIRKNAFE